MELSTEDPVTTGLGRDEYWRLSQPCKWRIAGGWKAKYQNLLQSLGYKLNKSLTLDGLHELFLHHRTAHVCYDACSDAELRAFATGRRLITAREKCSKHALVKKLMLADANPTFDRFIDLPAELRTIIYELYMSDFTREKLAEPTQPPLTRVSAILRKEGLPLFYDKCRFNFEFELLVDDSLILARKSQQYLAMLSDESISSMRELALSIEPRFYSPPSRLLIHQRLRTYAYACFHVSMGHTTASVDIQDARAGFSSAEQDRMQAGISGVVDRATGRKGNGKLTRDDFDAFVAALQGALAE